MWYSLGMSAPVLQRLPLHYGWLIVIAGTLGIFACLGFGRFALGMLLPSMASSIGLSYGQMGMIGTGNFVGYLIAVLLSGLWATRIGPRRLIFFALSLVGVTMILSSFASSFLYLLMVYTLTGMGSGASNVPIMGLVASWFASNKRGRAAGYIVTGSGYAIVVSGGLVPYLNNAYDGAGWRVCWMILGAVALAIAFVCLTVIRNRPEDVGIKPVGAVEKTAPSVTLSPATERSGLYRRGALYYLGSIYFLFGYTYVIYATFIVTVLVRERGFTEAAAGKLWALVGLLSLLSGPVFGTLSDRIGRKAGLIIVFAFQMTAYLLVALPLPASFLYLSFVLFGIVAWSIPSIMAATVGDYVGSERAAAAFGLVTFIFGFGQISGPAVAGLLAEAAGGFSSSFLMASAGAALGILFTAFLRKPAEGRHS